MPTPFTHLVAAQRVLTDPQVADADRALLQAHSDAFLLGSVVADGHFLCGLKREETHFYSYDRDITLTPWRVMMAQYPTLWSARNDELRAFLAGYVFHLSIDESWTVDMMIPQFALGDWGTRAQRFLMMHLMLIEMDERDHAAIDALSVRAMHDAAPHNWLPFMDDASLRAWGDLKHRQIEPGGRSETLDILAPRVNMTVEQVRVMLDSPELLECELWRNVPRDVLADVEARMVAHARAQMIAYLRESSVRI